MSKKKLYWISQISGWLGYVLIAGFLNQLTGNPFDSRLVIMLSSALVIGLATSHLLREFTIRAHWLKCNITQLIPRIVLSALVSGIVFHAVHSSLAYLFIDYGLPEDLAWHVQQVLTWSMIFIIWSTLYFGFHFFENYRKEEIKNLQWQAAKNEIELNKLKSQLNPHFIFNAMNTIRALVDENPKKSKKSITQLSNILRNTLLMGRKKLITFGEELELVKDYLELESSRYEERLKVKLDIHPLSGSFQVPPMAVQTLIENGIKHGISKLPEGGLIELHTDVKEDMLLIRIKNSGHFSGKTEGSGFGLINTQQRLELIFGEKAKFDIFNKEGMVISELTIPAWIIERETTSV